MTSRLAATGVALATFVVLGAAKDLFLAELVESVSNGCVESGRQCNGSKENCCEINDDCINYTCVGQAHASIFEEPVAAEEDGCVLSLGYCTPGISVCCRASDVCYDNVCITLAEAPDAVIQ